MIQKTNHHIRPKSHSSTRCLFFVRPYLSNQLNTMKVYRIFSFLLLYIFISVNVVAQNYMYKEEFDSELDWPANDNSHKVSVSNGQCYFENKKSGT